MSDAGPAPDDPRPFPSYLGGAAGGRFQKAVRRWRESGYDDRLRPSANPTPEKQALYDAYDRGDWPPGDDGG